MTDVVIECEGLAHPEGPGLLPDGGFVFVETFREQVSRWRPGEEVRPFSVCGGGPNACAVGDDGVYITQMGDGGWKPKRPTAPSIQRIDWDGNVTTIATSVGGHPLRAPNDLCFGPRGTLYFTDPGAYNPGDPQRGTIFSLLPDGSCDFVLDVGPVFPNGIIALPDDSVVWVETYTRWARRRMPDGSIDDIAVVPEGHMPDGFKASADGDLYITTIASGGVDVVSLDGSRHDFIETGGEPLNCVFSGESLYIADGGLIPHTDPASVTANCGRLLRVDIGVAGMPLFTGRVAAATE
jgi:gluconolactonase